MSEVLPSEQEAALALVLADGNIKLTAERLRIQPQQLIELISQTDLARLNLQIKAVVAIRSFSLLNKLQLALETSLDQLSPKEMAKAYTALLSTLPNLLPSTVQPQREPSPQDILNALPPELREKMVTLIDPDATTE